MKDNLVILLKKLVVGPPAEGKGFPFVWHRVKTALWDEIEQDIRSVVSSLLPEQCSRLASFFSVDDYWQVVRVYHSGGDCALVFPTKDFYYVGTFRPLVSMVLKSKEDVYLFDAHSYEYRWGKLEFYLRRSVDGKDEYKVVSSLSDNAFTPKKGSSLRRVFNRYLRKNPYRDYFIPKDLRRTLKEQMTYQGIMVDRATMDLIDLLHGLEERIKNVWESPRKITVENYVITLDRIAEREGGLEVLKKILKHKGMADQIKEWEELGMIGDDFDVSEIVRYEREVFE